MNQGNEDYSRVLPTCEQTPLNSNESADPTSILHSKTLDKSTESQSKESRQSNSLSLIINLILNLNN